jgi:hypothetical protein
MLRRYASPPFRAKIACGCAVALRPGCGVAAAKVLSAANELSRWAQDLSHEMESFPAHVRAA